MTSDDLRAAANDIAPGANDVAGRAKDVVSETGAAVSDRAGDAASRVKGAARAAYDGARERIPDDAIDAGRRAYAQGSDRIGRQVARQPIEALLLAGAIGYLVGWAANRS